MSFALKRLQSQIVCKLLSFTSAHMFLAAKRFVFKCMNIYMILVNNSCYAKR